MSSSGARGLPAPSLSLLRRLAGAPSARQPESRLHHKVRLLHAIGSQSYPSPDDQVRDRVERAMARDDSGVGTLRQFKAVLASGCRRALLQTVRCPALVLHGDEDPLIPLAHGLDTARYLPAANLEVIRGMGHDFPPPLLSRIERVIGLHVERADREANTVAEPVRHDRKKPAAAPAVFAP